MKSPYKKLIAIVVILTFWASLFVPQQVHAQLSLPAPGTMVSLSPSFHPPVLKGIKINPNDPLKFDFILDKGSIETRLIASQTTTLIKYFLAALTIPEQDLWVNLSPYEKDRIVPDSFGQTEMGRDLLAQDYLLKQITASLVYPEGDIGKAFWKKVYASSSTKDVPINAFNKVWIVPNKAVIYENTKAGTAYVIESSLKVLTEQDYLASTKNSIKTNNNQIVKDVVLPQLTKEVNEGANFAKLRQVYNALILATWYKRKIKDSIFSKTYADQNKINGIAISDLKEKQKIYERYCEAFKKGAYNYIKETPMPDGTMVPRKYFSGGVVLKFGNNDFAMVDHISGEVKGDFAQVSVALKWLKKIFGSNTKGMSQLEIKLIGDNPLKKQAIEAILQRIELGNLVDKQRLRELVSIDPEHIAMVIDPRNYSEAIPYSADFVTMVIGNGKALAQVSLSHVGMDFFQSDEGVLILKELGMGIIWKTQFDQNKAVIPNVVNFYSVQGINKIITENAEFLKRYGYRVQGFMGQADIERFITLLLISDSAPQHESSISALFYGYPREAVESFMKHIQTMYSFRDAIRNIFPIYFHKIKGIHPFAKFAITKESFLPAMKKLEERYRGIDTVSAALRYSKDTDQAQMVKGVSLTIEEAKAIKVLRNILSKNQNDILSIGGTSDVFFNRIRFELIFGLLGQHVDVFQPRKAYYKQWQRDLKTRDWQKVKDNVSLYEEPFRSNSRINPKTKSVAVLMSVLSDPEVADWIKQRLLQNVLNVLQENGVLIVGWYKDRKIRDREFQDTKRILDWFVERGYTFTLDTEHQITSSMHEIQIYRVTGQRIGFFRYWAKRLFNQPVDQAIPIRLNEASTDEINFIREMSSLNLRDGSNIAAIGSTNGKETHLHEKQIRVPEVFASMGHHVDVFQPETFGADKWETAKAAANRPKYFNNITIHRKSVGYNGVLPKDSVSVAFLDAVLSDPFIMATERNGFALLGSVMEAIKDKGYLMVGWYKNDPTDSERRDTYYFLDLIRNRGYHLQKLPNKISSEAHQIEVYRVIKDHAQSSLVNGVRLVQYALATDVAQHVARRMADVIKANNELGRETRFITPTGGTYEAVYQQLIAIIEQEQIDCSRLITFNMDEYIGVADEQSYRHYMEQNLFSALERFGWKKANGHVLNGKTVNIEDEVNAYEKAIRDGGIDLALGGIGQDGHIAFNEPIIRVGTTGVTFEQARDFNEFVLDVPESQRAAIIQQIHDQRRKAREIESLKSYLASKIFGKDVTGLAARLKDQPIKIYTDSKEISNLQTRHVQLALQTIIDNSRYFPDANQMPIEALTIGIATIKIAKEVMIAATGSNKVDALMAALKKEPSTEVAASQLRGHENVAFVVDFNLTEEIHARLIKYMLHQEEFDLKEIIAYGKTLGLDQGELFKTIEQLTNQKAFIREPQKDPHRWTSFLPIFRRDGTFTGKVKDYWATGRDGDWYKASCVFLQSQSGKLLLQIRKDGTLDISIGGAVDIGFDEESTAIKEAREELALDIKSKDLNQIKGSSNGSIIEPVDEYVIFNFFHVALTRAKENSWRKNVGHVVMSWDDFLQGKTRVLNDEVSGIVEVQAKELIDYYFKDPKNQIKFAQGLKAALEDQDVRSYLKSIDPAQIGQMAERLTPGGIDLNASKMNVETHNAGEAMKLGVDPVLLKQLQEAGGFMPVILKIQPLVDVKAFLGVSG